MKQNLQLPSKNPYKIILGFFQFLLICSSGLFQVLHIIIYYLSQRRTMNGLPSKTSCPWEKKFRHKIFHFQLKDTALKDFLAATFHQLQLLQKWVAINKLHADTVILKHRKGKKTSGHSSILDFLKIQLRKITWFLKLLVY